MFEKIVNPAKPVFTPSRITIFLICLFFGYLGIHRYLLGYKKWWYMPATMGGLWIWQLVDLARIYSGRMNTADGRKLQG